MNVINQPDYKKYKFKELKVYSSTDWLADNKKKYRQVFDRYDTAFIYAELSLYNKFYDLEDWEVDIELKCFKQKKEATQVCNLNYKRKVSRFDPVMYIREGWGNRKEGTIWKKGTYYWEAYVNGEKVGTKTFYIEDASRSFDPVDNPYLELVSLKLYEGPNEDVEEEERQYYSGFNLEEARYIYSEVTLRNLCANRAWQCELFVKFFNNARELKGQVIRLVKIDKIDDEVKITAGWGSNVKGTWKKDFYTAEIVFLEHTLAVIPFSVGDEYLEDQGQILSPYQNKISPPSLKFDDKRSFDEVFEKLDSLIGLDEIKNKVKEHARYLQFLSLRRDKGYEENSGLNVHAVFFGNPGTGKTTVAGMMGLLYRKMGLLSKGHVYEVDRSSLVGEYIGQTAPKVKEAIEKARGGVLFIDEAYSLARAQDDSKDFGREVIEILVKEMSNGIGDLAVIVAGYPKEMQSFLESNPGLRSRFKHYFEFKDYMPQDLISISHYASEQKQIQLNIEAQDTLNGLITEAYRKRDKTFGNARFVHDLVDQVKMNMGLRIMTGENPKGLSKEELAKALPEDVIKINLKAPKGMPMIPVDDALLKLSLQELDDLIGMKNIKEQIHELVKLVRYYRGSKSNVLNTFFLHTIFIGNPGTGKTTVARILARIYKALGILERGHMVETDRQGLVAGYVGQTAIKTAEKIDEAMGGVLFVDEAYALSHHTGGAHGDFGDEAIQTILKRMEDHRGEFFVFAAGYPDNMDAFIKANPGLASRFDKTLRFEDYSPEELFEIAEQMFLEQDIKLDSESVEYVKKYFSFLHSLKDKYFGNARTVRNIVNDMIRKHFIRIADMEETERANLDVNLISMADLDSFKMDKNALVFTRPKIGFGK
jgi:SpoVK/Ycf46/Vps4 family AAA+-type ATPase